MSVNNQKSSFGRNQIGLASILITMVLMIVITLIVLGFSQVARRNQRQALDRQLSSQAFYAAETGVKKVQSQIASNKTIAQQNKCDSTQTPLSADGVNVVNTCLLVNTMPTSLVYSAINPGASQIIPIISNAPAGGNDTVTIAWKYPQSSTKTISNCPVRVPTNFSSATEWKCDHDVLRFDLVAIPKGGNPNLTMADLESSAATVFLPPKRNSINPIYDPKLIDVSGSCNDNPEVGCKATINKLNLSKNDYYMRLLSIYRTDYVTITAASSGGVAQTLSNAQVLVDSTGRANDILRRIQVRLPLTGQSNTPNYAIQSSGDICKQFMSGPGIFNEGACATTGCTGCEDSSIDHTADFAVKDDDRPCALTNSCPPIVGYHFEAFITNTTTDKATIKKCVWDWDDDSLPEMLGANDPGCKRGVQKTHVFGIPEADNPILSSMPDKYKKYCRVYHPTLTITYDDGTPPLTYPGRNQSQINVKRPYGTFGGEACP